MTATKIIPIDVELVQRVVHYITANPSSQPVGVAVQLIGDLQQCATMAELGATVDKDAPKPEEGGDG